MKKKIFLPILSSGLRRVGKVGICDVTWNFPVWKNLPIVLTYVKKF